MASSALATGGSATNAVEITPVSAYASAQNGSASGSLRPQSAPHKPHSVPGRGWPCSTLSPSTWGDSRQHMGQLSFTCVRRSGECHIPSAAPVPCPAALRQLHGDGHVLEHTGQPEHSKGQPGLASSTALSGEDVPAQHRMSGQAAVVRVGLGGHLRDSAAVPRPCAEPAVARPRAMGSRNAQRVSSGCAPRQIGSGGAEGSAAGRLQTCRRRRGALFRRLDSRIAGGSALARPGPPLTALRHVAASARNPLVSQG